MADLRLRGRELLARAATSSAASTTSTGSEANAAHANSMEESHGCKIRSERRQRSSSSSAPAPAAARSATSLRQKGVKVVMLEAGARIELEDFVNDEWESFGQLAWLDKRTTSGTWRVAKDFADLPAWIVKAVGGIDHALGRRLAALPGARVQGARRTYGEIEGANLLDWPITLAEMEPWYAKAEDKMGVTRTNGIPGLPGNNNFKVMEAGAKKLGYKEVHTGHMAINSAAARRPRRLPADRLLLPGLQVRAPSGRRSTPRSPRARRPAISRCGPNRHVAQDRARRQPARSPASSISTRTARSSARRRASSASPATRSRRPRLLLQLGLRPCSRTAWPTRPARSAATTCAT